MNIITAVPSSYKENRYLNLTIDQLNEEFGRLSRKHQQLRKDRLNLSLMNNAKQMYSMLDKLIDETTDVENRMYDIRLELFTRIN